jgi:hypothetical protein
MDRREIGHGFMARASWWGHGAGIIMVRMIGVGVIDCASPFLHHLYSIVLWALC